MIVRQFDLPQEFNTVLVVGEYIHPRANAEEALSVLYEAIGERQKAHPDRLNCRRRFQPCESQVSAP